MAAVAWNNHTASTMNDSIYWQEMFGKVRRNHHREKAELQANYLNGFRRSKLDDFNQFGPQNFDFEDKLKPIRLAR